MFSVEEVGALLRACKNEQDRAMFTVAAGCGLRRGELAGLQVGDVDFDARKLRVARAISLGEVKTTKSNKTRTVPMRSDVAQALARLLTSRGNPDAREPMFPAEDGGYLSPDTISARYSDARGRAGLSREILNEDGTTREGLTLHCLRHTFATQCAARNVPLTVIQRWLGHSAASTTEIYACHSRPEDDDANQLDRAFGLDSPEARIKAWIASAPDPDELRQAGYDVLADALATTITSALLAEEVVQQ